MNISETVLLRSEYHSMARFKMNLITVYRIHFIIYFYMNRRQILVSDCRFFQHANAQITKVSLVVFEAIYISMKSGVIMFINRSFTKLRNKKKY